MTGEELFAERYVLRGLLGAGGMAEVRDAWDTRLDRPVAIKLLHPAMRAQPKTLLRFRDEARSAAMLSHPNIVAVHDYGEQEGTPFIVMERLPGHTLLDVMAHGPMPPDHVRSMLDDVLAALAVAHGAGMLHRDIKPANILLSATGDSLKVADFGIAKTSAVAHTMTGQIVGTMAYMSPERVAGAPASVADDLYAVGVVGYEAAVGHRAFPQDTPVALARAIMENPPPPLSTIRPDLDPTLVGTIDRAMAWDPAQRFRDAAHMHAAVNGDRQALFAGTAPAVAVPPRPATKVLDQPVPPSAHYPMTPPPPPSRWRRLPRRTRTAISAAALLTCLTVSGVALAAEPFSTAPSPKPINTSTPMPTPSSVPLPPPPPAVGQRREESGDTKEEREKEKEEEQKEKRDQEKEREGGGNGTEGGGNGNEGNLGKRE
ncbi:serine/threonine-protein kinase [Mycolicibacterium doricum]|uniref:serine/threonine-protein kinase n=1 Tax=Mycolicibacterium doricum TaxID=126673 RepID=UPI000A149C88|nr:serine/threonine-protein kinase [Mycolicibacterium doricum]MCV7269416.1 serine/threonine protein kinase [Mycolicibacterium doricum]